MHILAIETTGAFASVALIDDGQVKSYIQGSDRFSHLQNLTPQIQEVIAKAADSVSSINDIDAFAVSNGPGSFTGIRIGVSTGRALSQILDKPCVAVSSLEALAMHAEDADEDTLICPILDARRSQVYGGGYYLKEGFPVEQVKAGPYTIEEFMDAVKDYGKLLFLGDGVDACGEKIKAVRREGVDFADEAIRYQTADYVARLGEKLMAEGKGCAYGELDPEYMRIAEAERKLKEQQAKEK